MSELEIPERAVDAALAEGISGLSAGEAMLVRLEAAAPIIVAVAYRNRARNCPCGDCDALRADAAELDPEGNPT